MKTILYVNGGDDLATYSFVAEDEDVPTDRVELEEYVAENSPFPVADLWEVFVIAGEIETYFGTGDIAELDEEEDEEEDDEDEEE